jgi:hypothetical protein
MGNSLHQGKVHGINAVGRPNGRASGLKTSGYLPLLNPAGLLHVTSHIMQRTEGAAAIHLVTGQSGFARMIALGFIATPPWHHHSNKMGLP